MSNFNFFALFMSVVRQELDAIKEFVEEVSTDLIEKQKKLEEAFNTAQAKARNTEEESEIHSIFEDEANKYFKTFPIYTYSPILLTLYGLFESRLKEICDYDNQRGFSKITVSDLAGLNFIEKSKKYLSLVADINLTPVENLWEKIIFLSENKKPYCPPQFKSNQKTQRQLKGGQVF